MVGAICSCCGYLLLHNKPPTILVAKNTNSYYITKLQFEQNLVGDDLVFDSIGVKAPSWDGLHSGANLLGATWICLSLSLQIFSRLLHVISELEISPMGRSQSSGEAVGLF